MIFATGPLTGIRLSGSARHCVGAKSPLTNTIAKSEAGEFWGPELKAAGFDAVIIEGKADKPVYLSINDGQASIKDATHLWGKNTKETQAIIRTELQDEHVRVAMIGPGGEKLVRYACIMHGPYDAAGRGGLGAVMGSKNLKAVAVRGHQPPPVAKPEVVKEMRDWLTANNNTIKGFQDYGTGASMAQLRIHGQSAGEKLPRWIIPDSSSNRRQDDKRNCTDRNGWLFCLYCALQESGKDR